MNTGIRFTATWVVGSFCFLLTSGTAPHAPAQHLVRNEVSRSPRIRSASNVAKPALRQPSQLTGVPLRAVSAPLRTNGSFTGSRLPSGFVPKHERMANRIIAAGEEIGGEVIEADTAFDPVPEEALPDPETLLDSPYMDGPDLGGPIMADPSENLTRSSGSFGCGACGGGGDCGPASCGGSCGWLGGCADCCLIPCPNIPLDNFSVFGGVHGFKDPFNLGRDGSFGIHEGFNWGAPLVLFPYSGVSVQAGLQGVQSNFSGAQFTADRRNQLFVTAGAFRRAEWGLQGGLVYDYLRDSWYNTLSLNRIRGELSWVYPCRHEWGFWFAASNDSDQTISPIDQGTDSWEPTDIYAFFYRRRFDQTLGGEGRLFAGWSQNGDGLVGAEANLPLSACLALDSGFTYLIPKEPRGTSGSENEGWYVGINLVWYPRGNAALVGCGSRDRPLFRVAGKGSFFVDRFRTGN